MADGRSIVVGVMENDDCNDIRVFDTSQPMAPVHSWRGHDSSVSCLSLLPKRRVVSGGFDMTVRVWSMDSPEPELVTDSQVRGSGGHTAVWSLLSRLFVTC